MLSFGLKLPRVIVFVVYAVEHSGSFYIFEMIVAQQITNMKQMKNRMSEFANSAQERREASR